MYLLYGLVQEKDKDFIRAIFLSTPIRKKFTGCTWHNQRGPQLNFQVCQLKTERGTAGQSWETSCVSLSMTFGSFWTTSCERLETF